MTSPLKVGLLTTDNRDHWRKYSLPEPVFGPAIAAVLEGFVDFPEQLEVHVISATQKPLRSPPRLAPNILYHSLVVPRVGWLRTGYLGCIRAVRRKVRELNLDLVHGEGTERDCAMEAVFSNRPNLLTLHGNMRSVARAIHAPPFSYHWFHSFLEAWAVRQTRLVLCNSSYTEGLVRPLNRNVLRMPNAVRKVFYSPPRVASAPGKGRLRILMVGLVCSYKQSLEALRMLRVWRERGAPPFDLLCVGAFSGQQPYVGSFVAELERARAAGWAEHRVEMSEEGLRDAMDAADVLIHIPREEAFGLVVAEAMLRGMQVIAGRSGGIVDFEEIYPGIHLVPPGSPEEWMRVLSKLVAGGLSRIRPESWDTKRFHPRQIARQHLQAYQTMIYGTACSPGFKN